MRHPDTWAGRREGWGAAEHPSPEAVGPAPLALPRHVVRLRQKPLQWKGRRDRSYPAVRRRHALQSHQPLTRWIDFYYCSWEGARRNAPFQLPHIVGLAGSGRRIAPAPAFALHSPGRDRLFFPLCPELCCAWPKGRQPSSPRE